MNRALFWTTLLASACSAVVPAAHAAPEACLAKISRDGMQASQVMEPLVYLTETIGPRLTASPAAEAASRWAAGRFEAMGLSAVTVEPFAFGQGWSMGPTRLVRLDGQPRAIPALPEAWTPGTDGTLQAETMVLQVKTPADFAPYRGRLRGKIVLIGGAQTIDRGPVAQKTLGAQDLKALLRYEPEDDSWKGEYLKREAFREVLDAFLAEEGALAVLRPSDYSVGRLNVTGYTHHPGYARRVPQLILFREDFNSLVRRPGAKLEVTIDARFHPDRPNGLNVLADLPGATPEIVMAGAHLDSWHAGTGATDNAAGVAVVMEAARLLKACGLQPRRTIRFAVWQGEEQGMLGAQAYVDTRLARPPPPADAAQARLPLYMRGVQPAPVRGGPEADRFVAYFNMDAGAGQVRGIYGGRSVEARRLLEAWRKPLAPLGVAVVSPRPMSQTDDWPFRNAGFAVVGLIQDPLDYLSRAHHTDLDVLDYVKAEDLRQAAVVLASLVWQAANAEATLAAAPATPN